MPKMMEWVDKRFPATETWDAHLAKYYAPKNFNFWYFFGSLAMLVLVIQIVTGIFLTMHYKPGVETAFTSVEYIMRDVPAGWFIRYMHSTGASMFFVVIYLHMYRALIYGSFKGPRELLWLVGMALYLALMAEAFMGYLLPWGQMSYWGAQVIINLFNTFPYIGEILSQTIRGDFAIGDATLNRFFAFHVIAVPLILVALVFVHIVALHHVGSNNPDGVEIKKTKDANGIPLDGIRFHPYYSVKDIVGVVVFLMIFFAIVFFTPEMNGYFLEPPNFEPANPQKTPDHIAPVWYFTPFYTVLRAVPDPFQGTLWMFISIGVLFALPWIDKNPIKSVRYRARAHKWNIFWFVVAFIMLGWLGTQDTVAWKKELGARFTQMYFIFFIVLWAHSKPAAAKSRNLIATAISVIFILIWDIVYHYQSSFTSWEIILLFVGFILPLLQLFTTLALPLLFKGCNAEKPVPERVTG